MCLVMRRHDSLIVSDCVVYCNVLSSNYPYIIIELLFNFISSYEQIYTDYLDGNYQKDNPDKYN